MDKEKRIGVGFGVMILKDGKILLGKRHDDPAKADSELHGEGTWTMPGGKMHFHESFEDTCYREVLEETSLQIDKDKLAIISIANDMVPDAHFVTIGFLCQDFRGEPKVYEPNEITEWQWWSLDKLPANLFPASRHVLDNYLSDRIYTNY